MIISQFPHCDQRVLHAPGECEYCDRHPEWQELRKYWGIAFTGKTPELKGQQQMELPCPADFNRGSAHTHWGGNVPRPPGDSPNMEIISGTPTVVELAVAEQELGKTAKKVERIVRKTTSDQSLRLGDLKLSTPLPEKPSSDDMGEVVIGSSTKADGPTRSTTHGVTPGYEDAPAPGPVGADGQHVSYWVLTEEERRRGFVRPVRLSYKHVGMPAPRSHLRELTPAEQERFRDFNYIGREEYPEEEYPITGRYWTQAELDRAEKGCGTITMMGRAIAETYAAKPSYYGSTFCAGCRQHLPVGKMGEFVWVDSDGNVTDERVGT